MWYGDVNMEAGMSENQISFQAVYDEFHGKVRSHLGRLVGESLADDLAQEVFAKIHKGHDGFGGKSKLSTWVYRVATNAALDRLRSKAHRQDKQTSSLSDTDDGSDMEISDGDLANDREALSADREAVRAEMTECIREFVDRLPPDYKTVIILSELKELKNHLKS